MDKNLKKCYEYLDLPTSAKIDEVEMKQQLLVKIYEDNAAKYGDSYDYEIEQVNSCAKVIISNINKNGLPKQKVQTIETRKNALFVKLFILFLVCLACASTLFALL